MSENHMSEAEGTAYEQWEMTEWESWEANNPFEDTEDYQEAYEEWRNSERYQEGEKFRDTDHYSVAYDAWIESDYELFKKNLDWGSSDEYKEFWAAERENH